MSGFNRQVVIDNYYRASNALMAIAIDKDTPNELKNLCVDASYRVTKIIDYVNEHRLDKQ